MHEGRHLSQRVDVLEPLRLALEQAQTGRGTASWPSVWARFCEHAEKRIDHALVGDDTLQFSIRRDPVADQCRVALTRQLVLRNPEHEEESAIVACVCTLYYTGMRWKQTLILGAPEQIERFIAGVEAEVAARGIDDREATFELWVDQL